MDPKHEISPKNKRSPLDAEIIHPGSPKHDIHLIENEKKTSNVPHPDNDAETIPIHPTQPLLEPDRDRQKPPLAGPEVDDLEGDETPADNKPYPGIDDGLLDDKRPNGDGHHDDHPLTEVDKEGAGDEAEDGKWWHTHSHGDDETDFAYDGINGIATRGAFDPERPISPVPGTIPDVNTYQQKKNLAQGMMDLALLSANANQLRYVLESSTSHPYYYPSVTFISLSILLQVAVGIGLIMNSRYDVKDDKDICKADKINNMTVLGVFLVTIVNVFITSFSVATPNTITTAVQTSGSG